MQTTDTVIRCNRVQVKDTNNKYHNHGLCIVELHHTIYSNGTQESVLYLFVNVPDMDNNSPFAIYTINMDTPEWANIKRTEARAIKSYTIEPL